jgi:hypothetical protein
MATPVFSIKRTISLVKGDVENQNFNDTDSYWVAVTNNGGSTPSRSMPYRTKKINIKGKISTDKNKVAGYYTKILELAEKKQSNQPITGIAFSALGCSNKAKKKLQDFTPRAIKSVIEYFTKKTDSTITDIRFVINEKDSKILDEYTKNLDVLSNSHETTTYFLMPLEPSDSNTVVRSYTLSLPVKPSNKKTVKPIDNTIHHGALRLPEHTNAMTEESTEDNQSEHSSEPSDDEIPLEESLEA